MAKTGAGRSTAWPVIRVVAVLLLVSLPARAETCRYAGATSYEGHLAVRTVTGRVGDLLTVDVAVEFTVHLWMTDYRYLAQEISTWSVGARQGPMLRSVAVNQRSLADGRIKRQQWDVFIRNGAWLEAYRTGAKALADFQQHHLGFASHWPPERFGQPWLADFPRAGAARRPDLDLPTASDVQAPLALALYWSRFLPQGGGVASVVLPGFKRDKQVAVGFGPVSSGAGWQRWSTKLVHPALASRPASIVTAWVSPDHRLLQLGFDINTGLAAGQAVLRTEGCQGVQISLD